MCTPSCRRACFRSLLLLSAAPRGFGLVGWARQPAELSGGRCVHPTRTACLNLNLPLTQPANGLHSLPPSLPAPRPCLQLYTESTDGSFIEAKESALVWHYRDADPDFGSWQVRRACWFLHVGPGPALRAHERARPECAGCKQAPATHHAAPARAALPPQAGKQLPCAPVISPSSRQ